MINHNKLYDLDNVRYLDKTTFIKENERTNVKKGDILFTSVGTLGRSCVFMENINLVFQRSVSIITTMILNFYLKNVFDTPYYQDVIIKNATGTAQKGFYLQQLEKTFIPLPPLAEQKRIVNKINEIFSKL